MMNYVLNLPSIPIPRNFPFFRPGSGSAPSVPEQATSSKSSIPRSLSRAPSSSASTSTKKENRPLVPPAPSKVKRDFSINAALGRPHLFLYEPSIISSSASKTPGGSPVDSDGGSVYSFYPGEEGGRGDDWADPELALRDPRAIVPVDLNEQPSQFFNVPLPTGSASSADSDEQPHPPAFLSPQVPGAYPFTPPAGYGQQPVVSYRGQDGYTYDFVVSPIPRPRHPPPPSPAGRPQPVHSLSAPLPVRANMGRPAPRRALSDPEEAERRRQQQQQQQAPPPGLVQSRSPRLPTRELPEQWERTPMPPPARERRESNAPLRERRESVTPAPAMRERQQSNASHMPPRRESMATPAPGMRERRPSFALQAPPPSWDRRDAPPPPPSVPVQAMSVARSSSRRERSNSMTSVSGARYERERRTSTISNNDAARGAGSRMSESWPPPMRSLPEDHHGDAGSVKDLPLLRRPSRLRRDSATHTDTEAGPDRAPSRAQMSAQLQTLLEDTGMGMAPTQVMLTGPYPRGVRWDERLICPSPVPLPSRRLGWYNKRGDQLWTNTGDYRSPPPGQEYPPDLALYPAPGHGWENEHGERIDMHHCRKQVRSALKKRSTHAGHASSSAARGL
ncbi:hypothetical protein PENSPDRAFT_732582 [Peniophora sp. CONT]|nr:hypothetical protein PENSPDRAFT_732582 [Peniophora sp. CONT]